MTDADYQAIGSVIAEAVKKSTAPLLARIVELEGRGALTPEYVRSQSESFVAMTARIETLEERAGVPGPVGERGEKGSDGMDGRDGVDGASVSIDDLMPVLLSEVQKAVATIPPPEVDALISEKVAQAVSAIPLPKDGQSVTLDDVSPLIAAEVAKAFDAMPKPQDGLGIKSALIDHDGHLQVTLTNGDTNNLGRVVGAPGRDGMPGVPGRWGEKGEKGDPGVDGKNGTLDGLEVVPVDERTWAFVRTKDSSQLGLMRLSYPLDRGVFRDGVPYEAGDGVSFAGSFFIAQRAVTTERPEDGSGAWRLAVKRGRDGKGTRP